MEVGIIEREEWRSVGTSNGVECVMICGMKMTQLLCVDNLDYQKKVFSDRMFCLLWQILLASQ